MKKTMSSRERALTAFAHREPDRVPVNYIANPGIDRRLKAHFKLAENDNELLLQALGVDFRCVGAPYIGPKLHPDIPDRQIDIWGARKRWIEHPSGGYWDFCDFPLQDATLEQAEAWPLPSPDHFDYSKIAEDCKAKREFCLVGGGAGTGDIINHTSMVRGMEQVLVDLITDDPVTACLADRRLNIMLEWLNRSFEAAKGGIDVLWIGEDLGSQKGALIGLDLFRKHIRPRLQKLADLGKHHGIPVMIHSCGSSSWAFDDFIEMGIAVADTLQPEAKDMAPAYLKKRYGEKLAFHGCISTAGPLVTGSVSDIVRYSRNTLEIMKPGGGYAFAPTHQIQDNSPTENVLAMYETAREFGAYT